MSNSEEESISRSPSPTYSDEEAQDTTKNANNSRGGLLSNVLSFVSREITDFVVTATGGAEVGPSCFPMS